MIFLSLGIFPYRPIIIYIFSSVVGWFHLLTILIHLICFFHWFFHFFFRLYAGTNWIGWTKRWTGKFEKSIFQYLFFSLFKRKLFVVCKITMIYCVPFLLLWIRLNVTNVKFSFTVATQVIFTHRPNELCALSPLFTLTHTHTRNISFYEFGSDATVHLLSDRIDGIYISFVDK